MNPKLHSTIGIATFLLSGALFAISITQIQENRAALRHSKVFTGERMLLDSLNESKLSVISRVGDTSIGTEYYSGNASFSLAFHIKSDPQLNDLEALRRLGEIFKQKMLDAGAVGEGGLSVVYNNSAEEVKFRYFYTANGRTGSIDIFKINDYLFYSHSETTNIRQF